LWQKAGVIKMDKTSVIGVVIGFVAIGLGIILKGITLDA